MLNFKKFIILAASAMMASACSRGMQGASGTYVDPAEARETVVLETRNDSPTPMELRVIVNQQSYFVGSVSGNETGALLLDPRWFPAGFLYVVGIPADGRGRAVAGPLSASKGDKIRFNISPALDLSRANVIRQP